MAQDHFERHNHYDGVVDWNFNVVLNDQPSIAEMAAQYRPLLTRPELYDPIPPEWLHATILRIGKEDEYTETEMLAVADLVQERLDDITLSEFHFGEPVLIYGNVCFKIEPESELEKLYTIVTESLETVVGPSRATKSAYGHFIAHASLVYTKAQDNEQEIEELLKAANIAPATFRIHHMPLIKTRPTQGHYEWDVIKDTVVR